MSGHNKWAQIKHKKAATDAVKSRTFSRFARLIALESKHTNGDVNSPSLKAAIDRAKAANMPKDNIERAVAKGTSKDAGDMERVVYEAYGPGGIAIVVEALTDSRNRTTQEVKLIFTKNSIEMATPGAATWAFIKLPEGGFKANEPLVDISEEDGEKLGTLLNALDDHDDVQAVFTNARGFESTAEEE